MRNLLLASMMLCGILTGQTESRKFDFGSNPISYSKEAGYGFEPGTVPAVSGGSACATSPFLFSMDAAEGNYKVVVTLGSTTSPSSTTVKAESRRLMLEEVKTAAGQFETRSFLVNVRHSQIKEGESVRLKPRELNNYDWDNKLTLEFNNQHPCIKSIEVQKVEDLITVYLAGDSTVVDQDREPWAAWGQMLPRFFQPAGVVIANHAESGETLKAFRGEKRLDKILSTIKRGDYLFIQFTHNDQKPGPSHVDAYITYKEELTFYCDEARRRGAIPVLVTSMHRRTFEGGTIVNTMGDYPEAMRQLAKEANVALIDLNAMSKPFYEAMGPEDSKKAFVHYPANTFPGQDKALADNTHFNAYGAYELAKCVVEGIRASKLGIAQFLVTGLPPFDPSHPDPVENFHLPASPLRGAEPK